MKNHVKKIIIQLICSLFFLPFYCSAQTSLVSYKFLCEKSDSTYVLIRDQNFNLVHKSNNKTDSFYIEFDKYRPSEIYISLDTDVNSFNTIIIDSAKIEFDIAECNVFDLIFYNSKNNSIYQKFVFQKHEINRHKNKLLDILRLNPSNQDNATKESLKKQYKEEREKANKKIALLQSEYIKKYCNSYVSLFILNPLIFYHRRESVDDFKDLVGSLDSISLRPYGLFHDIKYISSLQLYKVGDKLEDSLEFIDENGKAIFLEEVIDKNKSIFIYAWWSGCRFSDKLQSEINQLIDAGKLDSNRIISINIDQDLSYKERHEIQSSARFMVLFYNNPLLELYHKLWIQRTPFGIVYENGRISKLACKFKDFMPYQ